MRSPTKYSVLAWLLGIPFSYLTLGFLNNFYSSLFEILLLTILVHSFTSLFIHYLIGRARLDFRSNPVETWIAIALFTGIAVFLGVLVNMASRFPTQFDVIFYSVEQKALIYFFAGLAVSFPASHWTLAWIRQKNIRSTRLFSFVDGHLGGLLLAALFFLVYFHLSSIFNQPIFRFDDIFFDTDSELWRWRFATEYYQDYYERTVHPYVLIIVRPLVWVISLFLNGNTLYATFALLALTGALCVYLVWYFVKETTGGWLYALLIASLFGASTSQLMFGSLIETYGFLGAVALIFIVLLLKDKPLYALVITGLAAFGITVSNIAQTFIAHLVVKRDIKQLIKYGLIVGALVVPLNLLSGYIYPDTHPYFWDLSPLQYEEKNVFPINIQRANYLARVVFLHSVVAPEPLLLKEDIPFLKVWMFRASMKKAPMQIASYETWFDSSVAFLWVVLILLGAALFLKNFSKQDQRFSFVFILTILFYFVLHLRYGRDVFLYSSNWTYAIILTLALAWRELSEKRWFHISLLAFIVLLLANNSRLILIMHTASYLPLR